jgi:FKBP-type peptidyl-prolyl cis-trans isomerase
MNVEMRSIMKTGFRLLLALCISTAVLQTAAAADEKPAFKDQKEKLGYAIGMSVGNNLKRGEYDVNVDALVEAIKAVLAGSDLKMTEAEMREALSSYQREMNEKRMAEQQKLAETNKKAGAAFLEENKKKAGIKTKTVTLANPAGGSTNAEFQYKVITEGTGASPKSNDIVVVNYRGTLIDGKEFDSSAKTGQPLKRPANQLIRGWTEALQMMKVGSKWELYVPSELAYGDRGGPGIAPGSTLIFEMELVGIETPQPLTSDIIRVPSAEELKAGAKVEVIKPEDVERLKAEAEKKAKEDAGKKAPDASKKKP